MAEFPFLHATDNNNTLIINIDFEKVIIYIAFAFHEKTIFSFPFYTTFMHKF